MTIIDWCECTQTTERFMPNLIKQGEARVITKNGEVFVNIALELTIKLDGSNLQVLSGSGSGTRSRQNLKIRPVQFYRELEGYVHKNLAVFCYYPGLSLFDQIWHESFRCLGAFAPVYNSHTFVFLRGIMKFRWNSPILVFEPARRPIQSRYLPLLSLLSNLRR